MTRLRHSTASVHQRRSNGARGPAPEATSCSRATVPDHYKNSSRDLRDRSHDLLYHSHVANKSYDQYCPVAMTLDAIGDRWTLLIVRELLYGPQRYSDLQATLPGIPPNLLASRLRDLEADGLVERQTLPPPAARTVFALTADGRDLERVVRDLGRWGLRRLPPPRDDSEVKPAMALRTGLLTFAQPRRADADERTWVVMLGEETFTLFLDGGRVRAQRGRPERADVVARIRPAALLRYRVAGETGARRSRPPVAFVAGSEDAVAEFERVFDLVAPAPPAVAAHH